MGTEEKSRDAFEPAKRYAAVGMQLGRVLLDDDFNEAERIRIEEARRINLDVIGPVGSPDDGFRVLPVGPGTHVDFRLGAGTLYLGGLRLWNPAEVRYALQGDWLQQPASARPPIVPGRTDLVYLEAWQQPVTATEDAELYEVALGGPDTSTRLRTMWRAHVVPGVLGDDCPAAWTTVVDGWTEAGLGTLDETGERVTDTAVTVTYTGGTPGDLCTPALAAGYLGAENQTLRVQLVGANRFTWGFDNGAPLYRAQLAADGVTITLLTEPRDQVHWPIAGQIVEVLPWSAVLSNGEKLAQEVGHLARVAASFDPDTHALALAAADAVPAGFGAAWTSRADAATLGPAFVYVRVWQRGDDLATPPAIPFVPGTPVALGTTGLRVTIAGTSFVPGDHWVIAVRPKTPDQVVPWDLERGRRVHGTRRFFAPLGLLRWNANGTAAVLHDCRPHFQPLTRIRGCCTYTVGDDISSFGRFRSIQAAIDALPAEGGKVCVLPGTYEETVVIANRRDITIEGCGPRSRIVAAPRATWCVHIIASRDITVRDLAIDAGDQHGIVVTEGGSLTEPWWTRLTRARTLRLRLEELAIAVRSRAAIAVLGCAGLVIRRCEIVAGALERVIDPGTDAGQWPAILSYADDALIEENRITAPLERSRLPGAVTAGGLVTYTRTALGGIQLGGGSERVELRRNRIDGGNGNGITLGSWTWVRVDPVTGAQAWSWWDAFTLHINAQGCIEVDWDPSPPDPQGGWTPASLGDVYDVRIVDNHITRMGRAGIGVARFFDLTAVDQLIAVERLRIEDNRIEGCLLLPIASLPARMAELAGQGAITLAEVTDLTLRGNELRQNGRRHIDPVCGLFALVTTGVAIEHNRITDNAPAVLTSEPVRPGWRGGIVIPHAFPPSSPLQSRELGRPVERQTGAPSLRIADNVITVPEGRAIAVLGTGPMLITDNQLATRGPALASYATVMAGNGQPPANLPAVLDVLGGIAVLVVNGGISNEVGHAQLRRYSEIATQDLTPGPGLDPRAPVAASGNVMFTNNQVQVDLLQAPDSAILTAVALIGLDDVVAADNQIEVDRARDYLLMTLAVQGISCRVQGNRIKEAMQEDPVYLLGVSIHTVGVWLNNTAGNQTTRCVSGIGLRRLLDHNQVTIELYYPEPCGHVRTVTAGFDKAKLHGASSDEVRAAPTYRAMDTSFDLAEGAQRARAIATLPLARTREIAAVAELARREHVDERARAAAQARVSARRSAVAAARLESARAAADPIEVAPHEAVVHGHVSGEDGELLKGATVRLVDAHKKPIAETTTGSDGAFRLAAEDRKQAVPGLLEVAWKGTLVHRDRSPTVLTAGKQRYRALTVAARD